MPRFQYLGEMETNEKCGIYAIRCEKSKKLYIGSSTRIYRRWYEHRRSLGLGKHHSHRLQRAWVKHGAECFTFLILEECSEDVLEQREQWHIDTLNPNYNVVRDIKAWGLSKEIEALKRINLAIAQRARAAARTHCPRGHPYNEANTYFGKKNGDKRCRICNAERVSAIYAKETPEQREARRVRAKTDYETNYEARRAKQNEYSEANREAKREYDREHRAEGAARQRKYRANETPEQRAARLQAKRDSYHRCRARIK